jgi:uncharacterized protein involved in exopolysaccharide biosynthesis
MYISPYIKLKNEIEYCKSQLQGWESFRSTVRDPNNILLAKKQITEQEKLLAQLEHKLLNTPKDEQNY